MLASLKILGEILAFWLYFVHCCMNLFPDKVALKQKKKLNEVQRNDQFFIRHRLWYVMPHSLKTGIFSLDLFLEPPVN